MYDILKDNVMCIYINCYKSFKYAMEIKYNESTNYNVICNFSYKTNNKNK